MKRIFKSSEIKFLSLEGLNYPTNREHLGKDTSHILFTKHYTLPL